MIYLVQFPCTNFTHSPIHSVIPPGQPMEMLAYTLNSKNVNTNPIGELLHENDEISRNRDGTWHCSR